MKIIVLTLWLVLFGQAFAGSDSPLPGERCVPDTTGNFCANAVLDPSQVTPNPDWKPFAPVTDAEGIEHTDCFIHVSEPASTVRCADGYNETS